MSHRTVSLDEVTYVRLMTYRARLELAVLAQPSRYPLWLREGRLSLDSSLSYLLDQQESHARRRAESAARQKGAIDNKEHILDAKWGPYDTAELPEGSLPPSE